MDYSTVSMNTQLCMILNLDSPPNRDASAFPRALNRVYTSDMLLGYGGDLHVPYNTRYRHIFFLKIKSCNLVISFFLTYH